MANFVMKKDGSKEPFDGEKIKHGVEMAAAQAGLSTEDATALAEKTVSSVVASCAGVEEIEGSEIRNKIVLFLETEAPTVAEAWKNYESSKA